MGWGTGAWGLSTWGLGGVGDLYLTYAEVVNERTVRVTVSRPALAQSTILTGDATNPQSWTVTNEDTDEALQVLAVREVVNNLVFDLYLLDKLSTSLVTHRVETTTLITPSGQLIASPDSYDFLGCQVAADAPVPNGLVDLKNQPFMGDSIAGTFEIEASGDYAVQGGAELIRKLVIRRLISSPTDWFFLDSTYGLGIRVKEPLTFSDMVALKVEAERQIAREPEVDKVNVSVSLKNDGTLILEVRIKMHRSNQEMLIPFAVPSNLVTL